MLKVTIQVSGPPKTGKTQLLAILKTAAVGFALANRHEVEVTVQEVSHHKRESVRLPAIERDLPVEKTVL